MVKKRTQLLKWPWIFVRPVWEGVNLKYFLQAYSIYRMYAHFHHDLLVLRTVQFNQWPSTLYLTQYSFSGRSWSCIRYNEIDQIRTWSKKYFEPWKGFVNIYWIQINHLYIQSLLSYQSDPTSNPFFKLFNVSRLWVDAQAILENRLCSTWKNENISNPTWIAPELEIAMNLMIIFLNEPFSGFDIYASKNMTRGLQHVGTTL